MYRIVLICLVALTPLCARGGDNARTVTAARVPNPPIMDGLLDDEVWQSVEAVSDFIQRDPEEGKPGSERTEIRVLYDDEALYFGCMFYDSQPDKIVARLSRRDNEVESDRASIRIDSYHDHYTGFEFTFNAAGVKVDILQYDDAQREDNSWDPVWDVQTHIGDHGWSAEVKIPFRILRYRPASLNDDHVWGINFLRYISRKQEEQRWAFTPKRETGFISRFGHLAGLRALPQPSQFEVLPFLVARQEYEPQGVFRQRRRSFIGDAGLDVRHGITTNMTLDLTINPDFGQVEADPAVLNLSTIETFYPEKRPFFIEGTQIIRFSTFGDDAGPGMFYSRRIGRGLSQHEVNVPPGGRIESLPQTATILGAGKLTGKTVGGFSFGILQAVTKEERAIVADSAGKRSEQIIEPLAHYNIIRLKHDVLDGSNVGMIVTYSAKNTHAPALTGGVDWLLKFENNTYQLNGFTALSHTTDSRGERVTGSAGKIAYAKIAGEHWLWSISSDFTSKRYDINDVGFFFRPNDYGATLELSYKEDVPAAVVRNYIVTLSLNERRTFDGAKLSLVGSDFVARGARVESGLLFTNYWSMNASVNHDVGGFDDRETRGYGLYRVPPSGATALYVFSDNRHHVVGKAGVRYGWNERLFRRRAVEVGITIKPLTWMECDLAAEYLQNRNLEAWITNIDSIAASIFASRSTDQYNLTVRSTVTFTRELTLQVYGQVFLAKGHYENFRQITLSTLTPFPYTGTHDFNRQVLNTNIVLRWEYLPGSTMFLVWSHSRNGEHTQYFTSFGRDFGDTFQIAPHNILLLKISYYWNL